MAPQSWWAPWSSPLFRPTGQHHNSNMLKLHKVCWLGGMLATVKLVFPGEPIGLLVHLAPLHAGLAMLAQWSNRRRGRSWPQPSQHNSARNESWEVQEILMNAWKAFQTRICRYRQSSLPCCRKIWFGGSWWSFQPNLAGPSSLLPCLEIVQTPG